MPRLVVVPGLASRKDYERAMLEYETQLIIEENQKTKPVAIESIPLNITPAELNAHIKKEYDIELLTCPAC